MKTSVLCIPLDLYLPATSLSLNCWANCISLQSSNSNILRLWCWHEGCSSSRRPQDLFSRRPQDLFSRRLNGDVWSKTNLQLRYFPKFFHSSKYFPAWLYLLYFWPIRPIYRGCRIQEPTNFPPRMSILTSREIVIIWYSHSTPVSFWPQRLNMYFSPSNNCHT